MSFKKIKNLYLQSKAPQSLIVSSYQEEVLHEHITSLCGEIFGSLDNSDLLWIDSETERLKLEDIAPIQSFAFDYPLGAMRLIYIHKVERLNNQAANKLLKTLEEPPETTKFILGTTAKEVLLPTIKSRSLCVSIPCPPNIRDEIKIEAVKSFLLEEDPKKTILKANTLAEDMHIKDILKLCEIALNDLHKNNKVNYSRAYTLRQRLSKIEHMVLKDNITLNAKLATFHLGA